MLVTTTVLVLNRNTPAFIYNELEWQQRIHYQSIEKLRRGIDYLIGIRTGETTDVFLSDQKKLDLVDDIDRGISEVNRLLAEHEKISVRQDKLPFLPKKYREYQQRKKLGFENYRKTLEIFTDIKKIEYDVFRLSRQLHSTRLSILLPKGEKTVSGEDYFNNLKSAAEIAKQLQDQVEKFYEEGVINEEFKSYLRIQASQAIDAYALLSNADENQDIDALINSIPDIINRGTEVDLYALLEKWHKEKIDPKVEEMHKYDDVAMQQLTDADGFYRDNNLQGDRISWILSWIIKSYPRNK